MTWQFNHIEPITIYACDRGRGRGKKRMSYKDQIREKASEERGFTQHPVGTFDAVVEEVRAKDYQGVPIHEIFLRTAQGRAKVGIWQDLAADIDGRLLEKSVSREEAEEKYVKTMTRIVRLYRDLGVPEPEGESDEDFEQAAYEGLGHLVGKACQIVVQAGRARSDGREPDRVVFVNAPRAVMPEPKVQAGKPVAKAAPKPTAAKAPAKDGLEGIPF